MTYRNYPIMLDAIDENEEFDASFDPIDCPPPISPTSPLNY